MELRSRALALALHVLLALLLAVAAIGSARAEALIELRLKTPPHAPDDAPDVIVHVPTRYAAGAPLDLVIFLHGFSSCARALVKSEPTACVRGGAARRGYGLAQIHERANSPTLLIVPQLAFLTRDARAPRFAREGGFDAFLRDVRAQLAAHVAADAPVRSVTLIAHSAGYKAAAAILRDAARSAPVKNVVLCDALYAEWDVFARFLRAGEDHRLISLYTRDRGTTRGNRELLALLSAERPGAAQPQPWLARLRQERVSTPHGLVPERHLPELLQELFQNVP